MAVTDFLFTLFSVLFDLFTYILIAVVILTLIDFIRRGVLWVNKRTLKAHYLHEVIVSGVDVSTQGVQSRWPCPHCGNPMWVYPYWDDPPENGGAIIGDLLICHNDDYEETR